MSAFAVAHPQISCIASLLWRSAATLDLLLLFVAIPANIFCACPRAVRSWLIVRCTYRMSRGVAIVMQMPARPCVAAYYSVPHAAAAGHSNGHYHYCE
ncbi:hypothetical protein GIW06_20410 [Pseudomonas syringae]|nr:hypothetical protein [Pseudomonas syringae]MCF5204468.1 hypothetical protein [Pseudomonas syringae]MCF5270753.1 hypothetical protein [Pseudomonas syringae]MCF5277576.1 hypothetical protein [Pseudomonas syringae]MCF5280362.1 hypothetical protein [Pseudomonas syringae]